MSALFTDPHRKCVACRATAGVWPDDEDCVATCPTCGARQDGSAKTRPSDSFVFATVEPDRYDVRYHVPRSQVWEGSRGKQRGNVHLHVKAAFHLGRIHRHAGEALCGKSGWYERPLDELEIATACPRCAEIELRRRGE